MKYAKSHVKQGEFFQSLKPLRILFWGNRVGKTEGCAQEVARYALNDTNDLTIYTDDKNYFTQKPPLRELNYPMEIWCACPSYDMQKETTQVKLERYLPPNRIEDISYIKNGVWGEVKLKDGTRINFKSYEQGREKFQGAAKRLIWFDEEPPKDIWDECVVRVEAGQPLDIIMSMTPIKGMTWVYDTLYQQTGRADLFISLASWDDNPWLTESQKSLLMANLSDEAIQVRRYGKFIKRVGLVCSWFDREKNLMIHDSKPTNWTWFEVLDGGFSDPAAYLLIGVDNDGDVHVVDGFREAGLSDTQIYSRRKTITTGLQITKGWIDYNDERLRDNLAKLGMRLTQVSKKTGDSGRWDELLAERLAEYGKVQKGTGKPRLFIDKKLDWLVQEVENLFWLEIKRTVGDETQVVPKWDDHRRFKHHFDGIRSLGYFLVSFTQPTQEEYKEPSWASSTPSWSKS